MDTTQKTIQPTINGEEYVIDIERITVNHPWTIEVNRVGVWALSRVGSGTWNEDSGRIENMTADLDEDVYNALDLAIIEALEG